MQAMFEERWEIMRNFGEWPVYHFRLPMVAGPSRKLSEYQIDIYGEGLERPTVVISEVPENRGMSVTNAIEKIATRIRKDYLDPLGIKPENVRWIEHDGRGGMDTWEEVTFEEYAGGLGYQGPRWKRTEPVSFDLIKLVAEKNDAVYRLHRMIIKPKEVLWNAREFGPGECYRVKMGRCSLDKTASPDDDSGQEGYRYCRKLAVKGQLWKLTRDYFGEQKLWKDGLPERDVLLSMRERYLLDWDDQYGALPDYLPSEVEEAVALFGAGKENKSIVGIQLAEGIDLSDGYHRICVATHLGIEVGAFVETQDARLKGE